MGTSRTKTAAILTASLLALLDLNLPAAETTRPSVGLDLDGDPLPAGAIARLGTKSFRTNREPAALSFLSDGKVLAQATRAGWVEHWDPATGRLIRERQIADHPVNAAGTFLGQRAVALHGFYFDPERLEEISWIGVASQLTGQEIMRMESSERIVEMIAISPDGRTVAFGRNQIHVVDVESRVEVGNAPVDGREIHSLAFSPDGKTLAVGSVGKLMLWKWTSEEPPQTITLSGYPNRSGEWVMCVAFSPDGKTVAVPSGLEQDEAALLIDVETHKAIRVFKVAGVPYWYLRCVAFSPDGKLLAGNIDENNAGGGVAVWDIATGDLVRRLTGMYGSANLLAFSPDGRRVAAACQWYRSMCVWDLDTGKVCGSEKPGHLAPPNTLRFFDGDQKLATAGDDGTIRIWNLADQNQVRLIQHERLPNRHDTWIHSMDVSPDGKHIASSGLDDTDRLWDLATGREIYRLPGHGQLGGYRSIHFTADSKKFATWGDDMHVYLWDVATGKALQEYRAQPAGLALPPEDDVGADLPGIGTELRGGDFSRDGKTLSVNLQGVYRFDVAAGKELPPLKRNFAAGTTVVVSPDEQCIVASTPGSGQQVQMKNGNQQFVPPKSHTLSSYRFADGERIAETDAPNYGGELTFSPDGRRVATVSNGDRAQIAVRNVPDLGATGVIDLPSSPRAVEFSASGKLLATALGDTTVVIWDLEHLPNPAAN